MLTSIPSPSVSEIHLGPLPLRAYAVMILIGIFIAAYVLEKRYVSKGGPKDTTMDVAFWMVIVGIIGARLYHVVTTPDPYFGPDGEPMKAFRIWEGGLGIWGAIAAGGLAAWLVLRSRGLRTDTFADAVAPGLLVAQAVGRLGNYFNQELYGQPTDLPWGLEIDDRHLEPGFSSGTLFHPTFLYELLWCLAGAALLVVLEKKFDFRRGQTFWAYVMIYTAGRVWIENLRIDDAQTIAGLRLNVWTSIAVFVIAAILFVWRRRGAAQSAESEIYLPGHEPADVTEDTEAAESATDDHSKRDVAQATGRRGDEPDSGTQSQSSDATHESETPDK